jgi:hypothetical protein
MLPLRSSGLDHLSITVPDSLQATTLYGRMFDPQVFHERIRVQRYYVHLGAASIALGPKADAIPYIDHNAAGVIDFCEVRSGSTIMLSGLTSTNPRRTNRKVFGAERIARAQSAARLVQAR